MNTAKHVHTVDNEIQCQSIYTMAFDNRWSQITTQSLRIN